MAIGERIDLVDHLESSIVADDLLICESGYKDPVRLFPQSSQPHQSLGFPVENGNFQWLVFDRRNYRQQFESEDYLSSIPSNYEAWLDYDSMVSESNYPQYFSW